MKEVGEETKNIFFSPSFQMSYPIQQVGHFHHLLEYRRLISLLELILSSQTNTVKPSIIRPGSLDIHLNSP